MYKLSEPFIRPEEVMLRTMGNGISENVTVGSCHMGVAQKESQEPILIGSCHMGIANPDLEFTTISRRRGFANSTKHKEVVVLG